jgi:hypothetical protein
LSDVLSDTKRSLRITAGNLRQNHLYIAGHYDFFPKDAIRGSKKNGNGELPIEIFLEGLNEWYRDLCPMCADETEGK